MQASICLQVTTFADCLGVNMLGTLLAAVH